MAVSRFQVVDGRQFSQLEIKKSKFFGHLMHTENRKQAMDFITLVKQQHADATHNCWAFQTGPPGSSRDIGCSDDGEPHGTAGKPILNVLMHANIGELTVVVSRYYGGVKLGTGGLARAYSDTAKRVIDNAQTTQKLNFEAINLIVDYQQWPILESLLKQFNAAKVMPEFAESVQIQAQIDQHVMAEFKLKFQDITQGKGIFKQLIRKP